MAEAFAVVKVGKSEWLFANMTPCSRIQNMVGESTALTDPDRNPSNTKVTTLCGFVPPAFSSPGRNAGRMVHAAKATANQAKFFFIQDPFSTTEKLDWIHWRRLKPAPLKAPRNTNGNGPILRRYRIVCKDCFVARNLQYIL